jgi:hypothetical protein
VLSFLNKRLRTTEKKREGQLLEAKYQQETMLVRSRIAVLGIFVVLCWLFIAFRYLDTTEVDSNIETGSEVVQWTKEAFLEAAERSAGEDDFEGSHINALCEKTEWDPQLVFDCEHIQGGIGESLFLKLRIQDQLKLLSFSKSRFGHMSLGCSLWIMDRANLLLGNTKLQILNCIRYAIDAGASIIMPTINTRAQSDLSNLEAGNQQLNYTFNTPVFLHRIAASCPQMTIHPNIETLKTQGSVTITKNVTPSNTPHFPGTIVTSVKTTVTRLKTQVQEDFKRKEKNRAETTTKPIILIPFGKVDSYYPVCRDGAPFADAFGRLLPFRPSAVRLAAAALWTLYSEHAIPIDPTIATSHPLPQNPGFLGIHLRTSADALPHWPKYEQQKDYYLQRMQDTKHGAHNLPLIYLASGNVSSSSLFSAEIRKISSAPIVTKASLLSGADREELENMTWDQQALVEYLILLRASYFLGMGESSFSWLVAVRRRIESRAGTCGWRTGLWTGYLKGAAIQDEFSDVLGGHPYGWEINMWP